MISLENSLLTAEGLKVSPVWAGGVPCGLLPGCLCREKDGLSPGKETEEEKALSF